MTAPTPAVRHTDPVDEDLLPFLFGSATPAAADAIALTCPQCAGVHLHLDTVHFATPKAGDYTATIGVAINPDTGAVSPHERRALDLHAAQNRGPLVSIGYWCEHGCRGRIELRFHKGHLYAGLKDEAPLTEDDSHIAGSHDEVPPVLRSF